LQRFNYENLKLVRGEVLGSGVFGDFFGNCLIAAWAHKLSAGCYGVKELTASRWSNHLRRGRKLSREILYVVSNENFFSRKARRASRRLNIATKPI